MSILFVDLVGSTAAADGTDPEVVRDVLRGYYVRVKEELEPFGATVEKFIGDAVMAVFGAPHTHADDAERAVRAGLRALSAVEESSTPGGARLAARAAVATGEVVVSVDVDPRSGEALAMGDVVNTAARLQSAAPEGGLVVDAATMRATRRAVRYREIDPVLAKGKALPVEAWVAEEISSAGTSPRRGPAPLVGRHVELSHLTATWARVSEHRHPSLITVIGTAGAGKSRLAQEFALTVDARVVTGRCLPYEQSSVYGAFAQQLKQLAGVAESDDDGVAFAKLGALVERVVPAPERAEVLRCASVLLGPAPDEPVVGESSVLLYSFRRLLESVAAERPTVFLFEDVHWAELAEYQLVRYLAQYVRDVPALLVVLARPELLEQHPDWSSGLLSYTAIPLEPLSDLDAHTIVEAVAGHALTADVVQRLVETGAGNPLFLEELATAVVERGGSNDGLPTTIRAAIVSRIDGLPDAARSTLLTASVIGRSFWTGAVSAASGGDVLGALDLLEQRDLVRRQASSDIPGDIEFRFKHALIRDVCYATLPRAERARAHAAVARYLEERIGGNDELGWLLAHHYEHAGDAPKAIRYLVAAAERAVVTLAPAEALALLDRAERIAADEPDRQRIRLLRGRALTRLEDHDEGYAVLGPLLSVLGGDDLLEALLDYARCCHWTERTDEVLASSERALALAEGLGRADAVGPALARLSQGLAMRGGQGDLARAVEVGEDALSRWTARVRTEDRAEHEHLLSDQYYWAGNFSRALALCRQARETAVGDPTSVEAWFRGTGMEAMFLASLGRYEEALTKFEAVFALADDVGRPRRVYTNYSTLLFRELFDLQEARERSEWVLDGIPRSTFHMPWMNAEADLLHTDVLAGEWGAAMTRWERLYPQVVETSAWERWLLGTKLEVFRAEIALHTEGPQSAAEWADRALGSIARSSRVKYEALAHDVLGRGLAELGRTDEAVRHLAAAAHLADELANPHLRLLTHAHAAQGLYRLGVEDGASTHHRTAEQIVDEVAAELAPERAERYRARAPLPSTGDYR